MSQRTPTFSARHALNIGKQSRAGALGLLAYDHFITLGNELEFVWWQKRKGWVFWLYVFNRFLAPLWLIFDTIPLTPSGVVSSKMYVRYSPLQRTFTTIPQSCVIYLLCDDIVTLMTTIFVQIVLQLRVYALYQRSRTILIFLVGFGSAELAVMAVLVGVTVSSIYNLPLVSTPTGCQYTRNDVPVSALFWIPSLIFEPILCALVVYKAWRLEEGNSNAVASVVLFLARDSLVYFMLIFAELLISTVIWARFPIYINVIMPWSTALPSLLGSRLLLNMRERMSKPELCPDESTRDGGHELSTWNPVTARTE